MFHHSGECEYDVSYRPLTSPKKKDRHDQDNKAKKPIGPLSSGVMLAVVALLALTALFQYVDAFVPGLIPTERNRASLEYVSPDMNGIEEKACLDTASRIQLLPVTVSSSVHKEENVDISFAHWPANKQAKDKSDVPLILVHGFDSSCLEYRSMFRLWLRKKKKLQVSHTCSVDPGLGSLLANKGIDTYAVDLLGWGFTQLDGVER